MCLGNICRSPLAEGLFRHHVQSAGLQNKFQIDSAATSQWHLGEQPDERSVESAWRHGIDISSLRSRQLHASDFDRFDWIVAMDQANLDVIKKNAPEPCKANLQLLLDAPDKRDVPDPYFGGADGFEKVFSLIDKGTLSLLVRINSGEVQAN
ncbi:low molecular weight protein-tyrosine-phosphatase [Flexibacterium corallicola]|uniref:low molecular weight protein-tyrosine-phosphatase n=1 Tax=Flexibacterium corallicola TaxID=3037259 RepID=UPI00286EC123|nr:low molecular weight protein-tyrosine-phosphatase [Pseudovibrio sp. M1P-2-3]